MARRRKDPGPDMAGMRRAEVVLKEVFGEDITVIDEGPLDRPPLGHDQSRLEMPAMRRRPAAAGPPSGGEADGWDPFPVDP